ncbi:hypothetical protein PP175_09530 [Aneurinibacillus sp. Ricciae_BoGa-3]|uniref:hypothetical protein n=1 Tax=Aneurinibacillus sp. Ricciae_BoGa-3 TaxID=3022697 RepID=UPI00234104AD|nr:hypothetical protein [Aneurinibacillus sp. Ricciae_BoGa-3]WCK56122.1 hypothetical protein PP175_09530 [Aneurinibacillus sp. Ricciae_BoGa-3]
MQIEHPSDELPAKIAELMDEHNPSWLYLSSPFRTAPELPFAAFRQPNISSWIQMEDP